MTDRLQIVVLGIMGRSPFAGVAWQVLHYLEGYRRLGHEVYYVEDTGVWPYDAEKNTVTDDCRYTVNYIARLIDWCGLPDRWAYRSGVDGCLFGPCASRIGQLLERGDALINVMGATVLRPPASAAGRLCYGCHNFRPTCRKRQRPRDRSLKNVRSGPRDSVGHKQVDLRA